MHTVPEAAEGPPGPALQRRARGDNRDMDIGEPRCKHGRTTMSVAPSGSGSMGEGATNVIGMDAATDEDVSYASSIETALSVCSQIDLSN